ncbi:MAG: hypothetical protein AVDCRST_MAG66-3552, partial [uncultured Pseudonocardia sp.]
AVGHLEPTRRVAAAAQAADLARGSRGRGAAGVARWGGDPGTRRV